jgi:hypothetical protein
MSCIFCLGSLFFVLAFNIWINYFLIKEIVSTAWSVIVLRKYIPDGSEEMST